MASSSDRELPGVGGARPDAERGHLDVLPHGEAAEQVAVLERTGQAGSRPAARRPRRDVDVVELDHPGARAVEAGEDVHERRLAGAVRPDQPHHLVPVELEAHVVERVDALEVA